MDGTRVLTAVLLPAYAMVNEACRVIHGHQLYRWLIISAPKSTAGGAKHLRHNEVVNHNQHVQCDREGDVGLCYAVELDYSQQEWTGKTMECGSRKLTTRSLVRTTVQATEIGD